MNVGVWVVVVGGAVMVVVIVSDLLVVVVVVVVGGGVVVVVVVVSRGVVVLVVVDSGVVALVVVVGGLLDVVVDIVAFEHPMIEVIKTKLNRTRRKLEYLLFINTHSFNIFGYKVSNIIESGHENVSFLKMLDVVSSVTYAFPEPSC